MSKKKRVKEYKQYTHNSDIAGIILLCFGLFMFVSIFDTDLSGILGEGLKRLLYILLGIGSYIMPFLVVTLGVSYIAKKGKVHFSERFYGIILFLFNTLLFIQMLYLKNYYINNSFSSGLNKITELNWNIHGGVISYSIDVPIFKLFGSIGSYFVFMALYFVAILMIFQVTIVDIYNYFKKIHKVKTENKKIVTENKEKNKMNIEPEIQDKDTFIKGINNKIKIVDFMKTQADLNRDSNKIDTNKTIDNKEEEDLNEELEKEIAQNSKNEDIKYEFPTSTLLNENAALKFNKGDKKDLINNASKLEETLASFGVEAKVIQVSKGPSVTRYELQPNAGVKVSKIVNLSDDIALNLASSGVRIEAPIPGKSAVGIEVPNKDLTPVFLREVVESPAFKDTKSNLAFCLGKDISGNSVVADLSKMPHLLIAGATGSGKSVCINTLIVSLLYKYLPEEVKLLMIDPKVVELSVYNGIPHLLIPVVTNPKKAAGALNWAVNEMVQRYKTFAENNVRNIEGYNELFNKGKVETKMPWIVIIIDELADLMMACPNDVEDYIARLSQMARAAGMHLVIATQRPSVDVITGVIKSNIPSRISFAVSSQIDSRTILDMSGAEKLLGKGDMLYLPLGENKPIRIQGAFISEEEVEKVVNFIKGQDNNTNYRSEIMEEINTNSTSEDAGEDDLIEEAIRIVVENEQASTSLLQRKMRIGYNRAARIIEQLEERGIISQRDGSKPRNILVSKEYYENR